MNLTEQEQRTIIVTEAMTWLKTPYMHRARVKGVGVDCAQILAAVYEETGHVPHLELGEYSTQWHLNHGRELFLEWLERAGARRIDQERAPLPADVGVWVYGNTHSHGGIVIEGGDDPLILHSHIKSRRGVILSRTSEYPLSASGHAQYWSLF